MSDSKASQLPKLAVLNSADLLYIVDDPNGTPASKSLTLKTLFGAIPANVVSTQRATFQANVTVTGSNTTFTSNVNSTGITKVNQLRVTNNEFMIANSQTPANSSINKTKGTMFFDENYLYITTANSTIKRIALTTF